MNESTETKSQHDNKQKSTKKISGYLKYVAKKYKAGFGKVHEELYRYFLSTTDQSIGQVKPTDRSFISYIPKENEDLGSSTSSKCELDMLSEEIDIIKHKNNVLNDSGICSAAAHGKHKNMFDLKNIRYSMPYLELLDESIYTNDRVLKVEQFTSVMKKKKDEGKENKSEIYTVPKLKFKPQSCYEIDDYINLRVPFYPVQNPINAELETEVISTKNVECNVTSELCETNTVNESPREIAKLPSLLKPSYETFVDESDDEDNYYLPPSQWTQSFYAPATDSYLYAKVAKKQISDCDKPSKNVEKKFNTEENDTETDDSYYVLPSKWV